uniref:tetratricopeptide repeat protein 16 n=1 Tax=Centroberyx gerrardi TaxID=166262 RepID=UPI003AAEF017
MDTSPDRNDQQLNFHQQAEDQSVFPTAVSEEDLEEARRESTLKQLFGSSRIFLAPGEKRPERADLQGNLIIQSKASEHYSNGQEAMGRSQYEKAVTCFSKALTLQPQQARLYVSQAEAFLQLCDFQSAAVCYKQALLLQPGACSARLAFIYYLQGQCLFDRGLFPEALESFTKAAEVKPGCRAYQLRSLACLTALGRYSDSLKLLDDWMASDRPAADLYTLRARLHQQLNQMSRCYGDVRSALALSPACPAAGGLLARLEQASERARQEAVARALTGQLPRALAKINTALELRPQDTHYLFRGILYRRLKDFTAAIEDLIVAVELSEEEEEEVRGQAGEQEERRAVQQEAQAQLVLTYNDFAVQCFSRGFYPEATLLLNKAIQEEKGKGGLYLNRGDCFFKQAEWGFALADYQQAEEMMSPDDPAVRLRLAVLHNTLGSHSFQEGRFQEAADRFSLAVQYNPGSSQYYGNRAKAFHKLLNLQRTRQDVISSLVLDPTNQEVLPVLLSVFPDCSVCDVLSSPAGQEIRLQLMDSVRSCRSSSHQQRSAAQHACEAEKELKPCVNRQELQKTVKNALQVKEAVRSFLRHRPPLHRAGPRLAAPPPAPVRSVERDRSAVRREERSDH